MSSAKLVSKLLTLTFRVLIVLLDPHQCSPNALAELEVNKVTYLTNLGVLFLELRMKKLKVSFYQI